MQLSLLSFALSQGLCLPNAELGRPPGKGVQEGPMVEG